MQAIRSTRAKSPAKAPTGITGFDEITGGGLPRSIARSRASSRFSCRPSSAT